MFATFQDYIAAERRRLIERCNAMTDCLNDCQRQLAALDREGARIAAQEAQKTAKTKNTAAA